MIRRPPRFTRTDTLFPYTTLFRSAIELPDVNPVMEDIDLADIARRAAGLLAVKASDHQIRIEAPNADETLPAVGEFRRALQIMVNLIGNAIRYSPEHSTIWRSEERRVGKECVSTCRSRC